jgi:hypothetical protein
MDASWGNENTKKEHFHIISEIEKKICFEIKKLLKICERKFIGDLKSFRVGNLIKVLEKNYFTNFVVLKALFEGFN